MSVVENAAWCFALIMAGILGIFVPMHAIVTARSVARTQPPFLAGPICASGVILPLLGASVQANNAFTLLCVASAVLWLIALIALVRAYRRYRSES